MPRIMEGGHGQAPLGHPAVEVMFLPFLAPGHINPMVETARLFAAHGVHVTIVITTQNALRYQHLIDRDLKCGHHIKFHTLNLSQQAADSPAIPETGPELFSAMSKLQPQIEELLSQSRPHCIISDLFFPWTADIPHQLGIPRIGFNVCSYFTLCCFQSVRRYYVPEDNRDETYFLLPQIPGEIKMMRSQLPDRIGNPNGHTKMMDEISKVELRSYGDIVNSFYELEPAYADYYKVTGSKQWNIGPLSLAIKNHISKPCDSDGEIETKSATTDPNELMIMNWLNSQKTKSVIYVNFGTLTHFNSTQLNEIAAALEDAEHPFIWVVRKEEDDNGKTKPAPSWLPDGYEDRMKDKGLILRGWAPQMMILEHVATGGFVTHCGWNSALECITMGMPMATWPLSAEQFYHEKLITKVLKVGVEVGVEEWHHENYVVKRGKIERAVRMLMGDGEEAKEMRGRAKVLGDMAKEAVQEGGSSHANLLNLIDELKALSV